MSDRIIKLLTEEDALTTAASARNGGQLFRIKNLGANGVSVVVKDNSTTTGSISLSAGEVIYIRKKASETIESTAIDASIRIVEIAFGD